ncbi:MAG: aminotransferase DegT [Rhodospirillales bacterium]|jgi:dTDP-4-amino-4,6-dideoxygalactose transaminase|nr:aminotransferase DegT [Rhodospirillales bacterium]
MTGCNLVSVVDHCSCARSGPFPARGRDFGSVFEKDRLIPQLARMVSAVATPPPVLLSPPHLGGAEIGTIEASFAEGWLAPAGPVPAAFEHAVSIATGFRHVLATCSGTAALHLAYRCLDLQPGDHVWCPGFTFAATISPAVQMGAVPRFLDVDEACWTLDPAALVQELRAAARTGRLPRVVVAVDTYGQCADLPALAAACDPHGVALLSDSAAGMGATRHGRHAGHGARMAAFSFNGNKIVTTGGGGALASDDPLPIARARHLARHAREATAHYQHDTTGYSYGLPSPLAAVGLAQLPLLAARVAARRAIATRYALGLADVPGVRLMPESPNGRSNRWLTAIRVDAARFGMDREGLRLVLEAAGIEARPVWKPLNLQPAFRSVAHAPLPVAERLFAEGLCLPSGSAMAPEVQDRVIAVIHDAHAAARRD